MIALTRTNLARAKAKLEKAEKIFTLEKALAETKIIEDIGGPKALGSNQADRERALTIALSEFDDTEHIRYQWAKRVLEKASLEYQKALTGLQIEEDLMRGERYRIRERELTLRERELSQHANTNISLLLQLCQRKIGKLRRHRKRPMFSVR